jgi:hypothetical protein
VLLINTTYTEQKSQMVGSRTELGKKEVQKYILPIAGHLILNSANCFFFFFYKSSLQSVMYEIVIVVLKDVQRIKS